MDDSIRMSQRARIMATTRRCTLFVMLGLLTLGDHTAFGAPPPISKEYQLKAAFLYHFTKFIQWPPERFADEKSPIVIAVLGNNPLGDELDKLVKGRTVNGRAIDVRFIASAAELPAAHIVFVCAGEESRLNATIFGEPGVLTVGESSDFAARGGIIAFTLIDEKVRFEINQASSEKAGLKLSGQLLKLATVIRKDP
jgi:hypothetical protein